ncbi:unnamed protein product [Orchesella dallaii]|uniref:Uncharacterized protein n=1 Tax=Orchesella dallaii TaxID=48710 RepID=A0ABP1R1J4_9HEXA
MGASQFRGVFIFGLDKQQCRLTFSWFSFPTFAASLRLVILIATLAYHQAYKEVVYNLIDSKTLLDSVLEASEGILMSTVLVSDVLGMFLMWKGRKDLELFINQFNETLILFADEVKNRNWMTGWFHEVSKKARWLVTSISTTSFILTLVGIHWSLFSILLFILGKGEAAFFDWTYPIFGLF